MKKLFLKTAIVAGLASSMAVWAGSSVITTQKTPNQAVEASKPEAASKPITATKAVSSPVNRTGQNQDGNKPKTKGIEAREVIQHSSVQKGESYKNRLSACQQKKDCFHGAFGGVGIDLGILSVSSRATSDPRTIKFDEMQVQYSSELRSVLFKAKRDANNRVLFNEDGSVQLERRMEPADYLCQEGFFEKENDSYKLKKGKTEDEAKKAVAEYVNGVLQEIQLWDPEKKILLGLNKNEGNIAYDGQYIKDDQDDDGTPKGFYFATNASAKIQQDPDGYKQAGWGNDDPLFLTWNNLVFANGVPEDKAGARVSIAQVIGDYLWLPDYDIMSMTPGQDGVKNTLFSKILPTTDTQGKYSTKQPYVKELPAINDNIKTTKQYLGISGVIGYGLRSGNLIYGIQLEGGWSGARTKVYSNDDRYRYSNQLPNTSDTFADGDVQYVKLNEEIPDPSNNKTILGKVYDPETGSVKGMFSSGYGRMTSGTPLAFENVKNPYELSIKKSIGLSLTGTVGYVIGNSMLYAGVGCNASQYKINITPNPALGRYRGVAPVGVTCGYLKNLKGATFKHSYLKHGENGTISLLYPGAFMETNDKGEILTLSGLVVTYPHTDDSGVSIQGVVNERPYLNPANLEMALANRKISKTILSCEPKIGVRTMLDDEGKLFIDISLSSTIGASMKIRYDAFAYGPVHIARDKHKIHVKVREYKISCKLCKTF